MPDPNVGQRVAAAWQAYVGTSPADTINDEYSQLRRMEQGEAFEGKSGGRSLIGAVEYKLNTTVKSMTDTETLEVTRIDVFDEWEANWKMYGGDYVISSQELAENRGDSAKFDLDAKKASNLQESLRARINEDILGTATGNDMTGLVDLISATPSSGTVQAIDRSSFTWWRNQQQTGTQTSSAYDNLRSSMRTIHAACSKGMGVMEPQYYLSTSTIVNGYESLLVANEQVIDKRDSSQVDAGIDHDAMRFKKAKVVWDRDVTSGVMYALNNKNLKLMYLTGYWFKMYPQLRPVNQFVFVTAVETKVQLITDNPRHLGVITSIT